MSVWDAIYSNRAFQQLVENKDETRTKNEMVCFLKEKISLKQLEKVNK